MRPYFSYGSNMDASQMRERCPDARLEGVAVLPGHRFLIAAGGFATIVPEPTGTVIGALWLLSESDEAALDLYEDIASGLYRRENVTVEANGRMEHAFMYVAANSRPGRPRPGYLESVVKAARELGLPAGYVAELERAG
jgi:gamma-glutamylcyclotransferase (GGCT)/AIG2-like uncharacterized protein YtfP